MHKYTISEIKAIKDKANEKKDKTFDEMGWEHDKPLSNGDINVVLEAMQELSIKK